MRGVKAGDLVAMKCLRSKVARACAALLICSPPAYAFVPVPQQVDSRGLVIEACLLYALEHPHIVRLHALVEDRCVSFPLEVGRGGVRLAEPSS